jgi:hypothetical protein
VKGERAMSHPEPWLSGSLGDVSPPLAAVLYSLEQSRQDLERRTEGLTAGQIWSRPDGLAPLGFQLRHIAGSVDRLFTYAEGRTLSDEQLSALGGEMAPGASREELLDALIRVFDRVSARIRSLDPATLAEPRTVGRKQLPTTVIGLLIHIAEHTQRHVGQAIVTARVVRAR